MSLPELEEKILYLWDNGDYHLINAHLRGRKYKLRKLIEEDESLLPEIERINNLLYGESIRVRNEANQVMERAKEFLLGYNEIEVTATFTPKVESVDDDSTTIEEILAIDVMDIPSLKCFGITINHYRDSGETQCIDGCHFGELEQDWASPTFPQLYNKIGNFPVCYALHCLVDHSEYSLQDIFRIKGFDSEININFTK